MRSSSFFTIAIVLALGAEGREMWPEPRNADFHPHRPHLAARRFGQEQKSAASKLAGLSGCPGNICGTLGGQAIAPLLAAADACAQQDTADAIINAAKDTSNGITDQATRDQMIQIAIEYRQAERNTPPIFSVQPNEFRNSVFCQKAPANAELNGLVQAQDPANNPQLFFDPQVKTNGSTVVLGSQANTVPFGGAAAAPAGGAGNATATPDAATDAATPADDTDDGCNDDDETDATAANNATATADATAATNATAGAAATGDVIDTSAFGKCSNIAIEFGVGFDGRKEASYQPVDKTAFSHGSAQNIGVITQSSADTLVNNCGLTNSDPAVVAVRALVASVGNGKDNGALADKWNAGFGIVTNFANGGGNAAAAPADAASTATATVAADAAAATASSAATATGGNANAGTGAAAAGGAIDVAALGKCSNMAIEFGTGFDGRKEASFQPVDKANFSHPSAQNIGIITQSSADTLVNNCGLKNTDDVVIAVRALVASIGSGKDDGSLADRWNAGFGITTNFATNPLAL